MSAITSPSSQILRSKRSKWRRFRTRVIERDQEQCCYVGSGGKRCNQRIDLSVHHMRPIGLGGNPFSLDNCVTICVAHHDYIHRPDARQYGFVLWQEDGWRVRQKSRWTWRWGQK